MEDRFSKDATKKDGLSTVCKNCRNVYMSKWWKKDPDKTKAYGKMMYQKHREKRRIGGWHQHLKYKYGISSADYDQMLKDQGGVCAICEQGEIKINKHKHPQKLSVDHNHFTGKVRALICHKCNIRVAWREDELNKKVDEYLVKHQ